MAILHVLRVFCSVEREFGNPLGVFLEGADVPEARRQEVATELGFSETVFVDEPATGTLRIFTPGVELPFAGHPLVGAAWLLARELGECSAVRPPAGEVGVRIDEDGTFISAHPDWVPGFELVQLEDSDEVRNLDGPPTQADEVYAWAWIDEAAGSIRARSFAPGFGIAEDEATGAAALGLCARLGRPITIHQGRGSVLITRPLPDGRVEVGGVVVAVERREHPV